MQAVTVGTYTRWIIGKPVLMGAYYRLGDFTAPSVVLITEGIADAISCFEATGYPCLAAISKGQLLNAGIPNREKTHGIPLFPGHRA